MPQYPTKVLQQLQCIKHLSGGSKKSNFQVAFDNYARVTWDIVQVFQFKRVKAEICISDSCHRDIPISHPELAFLDMENQLVKKSLPEVTCMEHFSLKVKACTSGGQSIQQGSGSTLCYYGLAAHLPPLRPTYLWDSTLLGRSGSGNQYRSCLPTSNSLRARSAMAAAPWN